MGITVDKMVVVNAIVQAYDVFAQLGYEVPIRIIEIDPNTGDDTTIDSTAL